MVTMMMIEREERRQGSNLLPVEGEGNINVGRRPG